MRRIVAALRILALFAVGLSVFLLWAVFQAFADTELRGLGLDSTSAARASPLIALLVPLLLPALPTAVLWPKRPLIAASTVAWFSLAFTLNNAFTYRGATSAGTQYVIAILEGGFYWLSYLCGVYVAARYWPPRNNTAKGR
jgi:hypothetical protein